MKTITTARQIGQAIRENRLAHAMTQQQLADAAGVSRGFISRIEKGASTAVYPEKLLNVLAAVGLIMQIGEGERSQEKSESLKPSKSVRNGAQDYFLTRIPSSDAVAKARDIASLPAFIKAAEISRTARDHIPPYIEDLRISPALLKPRSDIPQKDEKEGE